MKQALLTLLLLVATATTTAQNLENMQWFNEPESWSIKNGRLTMEVTPQSDYWRISHYGFTVDNAPFLYTLRGGESEALRLFEAANYDQRPTMMPFLSISTKQGICSTA